MLGGYIASKSIIRSSSPLRVTQKPVVTQPPVATKTYQTYFAKDASEHFNEIARVLVYIHDVGTYPDVNQKYIILQRYKPNFSIQITPERDAAEELTKFMIYKNKCWLIGPSKIIKSDSGGNPKFEFSSSEVAEEFERSDYCQPDGEVNK